VNNMPQAVLKSVSVTSSSSCSSKQMFISGSYFV
jgi:hypothetical protein